MTVPDEECFSLSNGAVVHNSSHGAAAFRYLAVGHKTAGPKRERAAEPRRVITLGQGNTEWMSR